MNAEDNDGNTALIQASWNGHTDIVELIKKHMYQENIIKAAWVTQKGRTKDGRPLLPPSQSYKPYARPIAFFGGKRKTRKLKKTKNAKKTRKRLKKVKH